MSNCDQWNNFRICENNGIICIGYDVVNSQFTGIFNDVNGVLQIPDVVTHNGNQRTVEVLSMSAFGYSSIRKVYLPYTVHTIKRDAFIYCPYLRQVIFPENTKIKSLGQGSFFGLSSMRSFWIPTTVTELGGQVFGKMDGLHIYYCGETSFSSYFMQSSTMTAVIHVSSIYPYDTLGQYTINDYDFQCYYEKLYKDNTFREVRKNLASIYLFILIFI